MSRWRTYLLEKVVAMTPSLLPFPPTANINTSEHWYLNIDNMWRHMLMLMLIPTKLNITGAAQVERETERVKEILTLLTDN